MARTKANPSIEETISKKIEGIKSEIETLQQQLNHWEKISSDYETNKVTIESILSVHQAPALDEKPKSKAGRKPKL